MIKNLPEPITINEEGTANVIGWVGTRSFVVKVIPETITTGIENDTPESLDTEENPADLEYVSLWDWAKDNSLSVTEFQELQERLETYIDTDWEASAGIVV